MGRRLLAFGLSVAIQAGAVSAPLVHAHVEAGHDGHHASGRIHAHVGGHGAVRAGHDHDGHPSVRAADGPDHIVHLKLFVATAPGAGIAPALASIQFEVAPPLASVMGQPPQVVRSHGPPSLALSPSRAPPSSSVLI